MGYDLAEIANIEDEINNVNGKTFKIFQLTIRQRLKLDVVLKSAEKKVNKILNPSWWDKFLTKILRRSQMDIFNGKSA